MSAIQKILHLHNSNLNELDQLERDWLINWIGWEWFNIDLYVKESIKIWEEYNQEKIPKLYQDLRILALLHDRAYLYKQGFYCSNYMLARDLFILLNWTSFLNRFVFSLGIFILTCIYWKRFYYKK